MLPVLNVGGLAFQTRGLVLLVGFALAIWIADDFARRRSLREDLMSNAGLVALLAGLLGARLAFALQHFESYWQQPAALFSLTVQGMAWPEGMLIAALAAYLYLQRQGAPLPDVADALVPALAAFWAMAALSAFLSGDAYGQPTTIPWAVYLWGTFRHPVQLYELMAGGVILLALSALWPRAPYPGWISLVGLALLGAARLLVEGFRGDPAVLTGGVRVAQLWALALTLLALWLLYRNEPRPMDQPSTTDP